MTLYNEEKIEEQKDLIIKIINTCDKYFEENHALLFLDGNEADLLLPRRFAIYLIREHCNTSMMKLSEIFDTSFKGVYLDHSYIHEKVVSESVNFINIINELKNSIFNKESLTIRLENQNQSNKLSNNTDIENQNVLEEQIVVNEGEYTQLIRKAFEARENAYVPYSMYSVGAVVITENGSIYTGANIENASYGLSVCAERNAIFSAICDGNKKIKKVVLVAGQKGEQPSEFPCPCGACLQVMNEFATNDFKIILAKNEKEYIVKTLGDMLPNGFKLK